MPNSKDPRQQRQRARQPARQDQRQQIAQQEDAGPGIFDVLTADLERNSNVFGKLLAKGTRAATAAQVQRFTMECYQAVWHKPALLKANRDSLLLAFAEAAVVGLSLNPTAKEAFLETRSNIVRFGTQYQGLVKLMHRGAAIDFIFADVVRRGDHFRQVGGSAPEIDHVAVELGFEAEDYDDDDAILAAYAVVKTVGGTRAVHEVARRKEIMQARAMSKGKGGVPPSPAWAAWFSRMAKKLPLRRLANIIPGADEARMVLGIEDAQARGEAVTFERVSQVFDPIAAPRPSVDSSKRKDGVAAMMAASGPAGGEPARGEEPHQEPREEPPQAEHKGGR